MSSKGTLLKNEDTGFSQNLKEMFLKNQKIWHATIELTYRCNFKCKHCYCQTEEKKELSLEEIDKLAQELRDLGVITLTLTGGEALLRKDIFEIIECFNNYGFIITLFSNAYLITQEIAQKLKKSGVKCVEISIYGANDETYFNVTGVTKGYTRLLNAYKSLSESGINIVNKSVSLSLNINDAQKMIDTALSNGELKVKFDPVIFPKMNYDKTPQDFSCKDSDIYDMFTKTLEENDVVFVDRKKDTRICSVGGSIVINPYGDVYPCTAFSLSIGNIRNNRIKDIWENSEKLNRLRSLTLADYPKCFSCEYYDFCNVCPALFYMENKSVFSQSRESCRIAMLKKQAYIDKFVEKKIQNNEKKNFLFGR